MVGTYSLAPSVMTGTESFLMYCVVGTLLEAPRRSAFAEGILMEAKGATELATAEVRPAAIAVVVEDTTEARDVLIFVVEDELAATDLEVVLEVGGGFGIAAVPAVEIEISALVVGAEDETNLVADEDLMTLVEMPDVMETLELGDGGEDVLSTMQE